MSRFLYGREPCSNQHDGGRTWWAHIEFNVFNRANFASPNAMLTDPNFGTSHSMMNASFGSGNSATGGGYNSLYTMGGPRTGQLAVKLLF
jgi:hypothetical protein